jgi:hypothetical protein
MDLLVFKPRWKQPSPSTKPTIHCACNFIIIIKRSPLTSKEKEKNSKLPNVKSLRNPLRKKEVSC